MVKEKPTVNTKEWRRQDTFDPDALTPAVGDTPDTANASTSQGFSFPASSGLPNIKVSSVDVENVTDQFSGTVLIGENLDNYVGATEVPLPDEDEDI